MHLSLVPVTLILVLAGCGPLSGDSRYALKEYAQQAELAGATENAEALRDGTLTEEEFYAAADRFKLCMEANSDFTLVGPFLSPVDHRSLAWEYQDAHPPLDAGEATGPPPPSAHSETSPEEHPSEVCHQGWFPMAHSYQVTRESRMAPLLQEAVSTCLREQGVTPPEQPFSLNDLLGSSDQSQSAAFRTAEECVISSATRLYPEQPSVIVAL